MLHAATTLHGQPSSVPAARRWTLTTLQAWGLPDTAWTAAQVVSELATNATLHARTAFTVTLTVDAGCLRIEAADESPVLLQSRRYSETATTGRGLRMVEVLSSDWGVRPDEAGKAVWALLALEEDEGGVGDRSGSASRGVSERRAGVGPGAAPRTVAALQAAA